ncbi:retinoid-inducible serine carboxypeptidase-like [Scaptodrosophila lebanonensis]|uniref:Carboxypeptidase n=1 Tax=Drosophila lebanonensis TaxID=7225 RepID=A0A6J2TAB4_DROLE|nr:retinoid-inducible serine carboxypeptidase-like [Scaptodrosophila lebanonensis]
MVQTSHFFVLLALLVYYANGRAGYGPGEQDWGYVDIRTGAHMFYWLYYTTANVSTYTTRPLVIWLQGGPGASSTGYGNFEELGPVDLFGHQRNWTWVKDMNVIFIDNPVGSGFSYVDNPAYYTATNKEVALDLVNFMKGFYALHPEFETVPLHIFSESYGGKMATDFALELYNVQHRGELKSNLVSVALGDPWISPIDSVLAWGPMLLQFGLVDHEGYESIMTAANLTAKLVEDERWIQATAQWDITQDVVLQASKGVDSYNVLKKTREQKSFSPKERLYRAMNNKADDLSHEDRDQMLLNLMRGPVAKALGIPKTIRWGSQGDTVFEIHQTDFMKPVIHIVNELLNKTSLKVGVYSGSLDLICATPGTLKWIEKLDWNRKWEYAKAPRTAIYVHHVLEGYQKTGGNFSMFWINRSGHMVPADNPAAMSHVLRKFTNYG